MSNHLKDQSSPYLLQHAENPVDWYPWGEEAFERAQREDKPVFLSIGYSTCHWCHVMAHESFEDPRTADILNRHFISVKVDREERPDIDSVYMNVCQMLTGSGGWPMSIFMTAGQKPFFAGTYFPPVSRYGTIGFPDLLLAVAEKWKNSREELLESAERILTHVSRPAESLPKEIHGNQPKEAADIFSRSFDAVYGGFGQPPKFPTPHNLIFLTLYSRIRQQNTALEQVLFTLDHMRRGGIFDQIGYGFSRYSTDRCFLVPHFEKMLYDNALLILAYCAAYKASGEQSLLDTAEKTAEYIFREMTGEEGEFYSAQDADSEGEEGKYYVWRYEEILEILGAERGEQFCSCFGITREGNFEGRNIPNLLNGKPLSDDFDKEKKALYAYRKSRASLHLDDKILTAWNALMICALSVLYRVTGNGRYLAAARKAASFIEEHLAEGNILYVSCRSGVKSGKGFLDEYACYASALISLYEACGNPFYLKRGAQFCQEARKQFEDEEGGYFLYGEQNSRLISRPKETYDGAIPSGNSMMAYCLVRLSQLMPDGETSVRPGSADGEEKDGFGYGFLQAAEKQLRFMEAEAAHNPAGYCMYLTARLLHENPPMKINVVLSKSDRMEELIPRLPLCADVKMYVESVKNGIKTEKTGNVKNVDNCFNGSSSQPFTAEAEGYKLLNGKTTYYVCKNHTCFPPTNQMPEQEFLSDILG